MQSYQIKWPLWKYIIDPKFLSLVDNKDRYIAFNDSKNIASDFVYKKLIFRCLRERHLRFILTSQDSYLLIKEIIIKLQYTHLFEFDDSKGEIICINGNWFMVVGLNEGHKLKYQKMKDPSGVLYLDPQESEKEYIKEFSSTIKTKKSAYLQEIFLFTKPCEHFNWLHGVITKPCSII